MLRKGVLFIRGCSFTLLRVLAIENCNLGVSCQICIEHVRHLLLHVRYLSLSGTIIHRIPEGIGASSTVLADTRLGGI